MQWLTGRASHCWELSAVSTHLGGGAGMVLLRCDGSFSGENPVDLM